MLKKTIPQIIILILLVLVCQPKVNAQGTKEDYERSEKFGFYHVKPEIKNMIFKTNVEPHWFDDNTKFWYRNDIRDGGREFILVDVQKETRRPAFDHKKMAQSLSVALNKEYTPQKLLFERISFAENNGSVEFVIEKEKWVCGLGDYKCRRIGPAEEQKAEQREQPGRQRGGYMPDISKKSESADGNSPDGKWQAVFSEYNIFLQNADSNEMIQLTSDGNESSYYANPLWSPDSKKFLCSKVITGDEKKVYYLEAAIEGRTRAQLHEQIYPQPGDKITINKPVLFDIENEKQIFIDDGLFENPYFTTPCRWKPDSSGFTFRYVQRGWQVVRLIDVDAPTGNVRALIEDKTDVGALVNRFEYLLNDSNEIIWESERDGFNHPYLFDSNTGALKKQLTSGQWVVRGVEYVDEEKREICFIGAGRENGRDPYLAHYYRLNIDTNDLLLLTPGNGDHSVQFSPDRKFYIDTYSRADLTPITELRRTSDGRLICMLEEADIGLLEDTGWKMPEPFVAKGRDGRTDIYGLVYRPTNLNESKKYPVIEKIYNGPHGFHCPKSFDAYDSGLMQPLAELGFITVIIDGMGTGGRSKAFRDVSYKNLGDAGLPDHIAWLKALAEKYPYVDLSRVGIFGYSAGGYDSTRALLAHQEFYKAAVSLAGNHDHRVDKLSWNEQWMGYPVGEHYAEQSNATNAGRLKGKLLIICGALDTNVPPESTLQLADALIKADKDFEMFIHPAASHDLGDNYTSRKIEDFFVKNLLGVNPPDRNEQGKE